MAVELFPTELRATATGIQLGMGRVAAILGSLKKVGERERESESESESESQTDRQTDTQRETETDARRKKDNK